MVASGGHTSIERAASLHILRERWRVIQTTLVSAKFGITFIVPGIALYVGAALYMLAEHVHE